jgi:hypothetical protein
MVLRRALHHPVDSQEQWDALLSHTAELREFIDANKSRLKTKDISEK